MQCAETSFASAEERSRHIEDHFFRISKSYGALLCRCHPCTNILSQDEISLNDHMIHFHHLPLLSTHMRSNDPAYRLVEWCGFCKRWLCQLDEPFNKHASEHEVAIGEIIRFEGYNGTMLSSPVMVPPINPFRVHDESGALASPLYAGQCGEKHNASG